MREYGVEESLLFQEADLLHMTDIPRVSKCLKEVAIIVSMITYKVYIGKKLYRLYII